MGYQILMIENYIVILIFFNNEEGSVSLRFDVNMAGIYSVCFDNRVSRWTPKTIDFKIFKVQSESGGNASGEIDPMKTYLKKSQKLMDDVSKTLSYLKRRERRHRLTQESTNDRVLYFSLAESITLVLVSVVQVVWLRRWFKVDASLGRV